MPQNVRHPDYPLQARAFDVTPSLLGQTAAICISIRINTAPVAQNPLSFYPAAQPAIQPE